MRMRVTCEDAMMCEVEICDGEGGYGLPVTPKAMFM